ncbi:hypothetical protein QAD02_024332 [Eretmocerus hayati]|uniref:Uncharacterized protein n=1 Tax=Eretmocerus hayati TaxID=131215 RepID=A0ACC2PYJ4_9HYME|nr:hypothetical protein QAD02_024332 [Eretmocerus hayati]
MSHSSSIVIAFILFLYSLSRISSCIDARIISFVTAGVSAAGATCRDVNGLFHETGYHYIPGPEPCTLCVCDNGNPTLCKAVLCKYKEHETLPNKDCKTFRFGSTCCELICLDDAVSSTTNDRSDAHYDLGLRLIASFLTFLISLGLFIYLLRLRQRKIRAGRQNHHIVDDPRSSGSMGYLDRNNVQHAVQLDDLPCNGGYPLWKPPSSYFPRGEAPPPYEEAVAAARAEQALLSISPHTLSPLNFPGAYHHGHANGSMVANSQNGLPASSPTLSHNNGANTSPSISTHNRPLSSPAAHSCYQMGQAESAATDFCVGSCSTSFADVNVRDNLSVPGNRSDLSNSASNITSSHPVSPTNQLLLPNSQSPRAQNAHQHHTTLPRQSGAFTISATVPDSSAGVHRTIPRSLAPSGSLRLRREYSMHQSAAPLFNTPLVLQKSTKEDRNPSPRSSVSTVIPSSVPSTLSSGDPALQTNVLYDSACSRDLKAAPMKLSDARSSSSSNAPAHKPTLTAITSEEGSFDSVCTCNAQALPPLHDDADDYRSECENCKSANASRYYVDNEDELTTSPHETMTLQRRPEDATSSTTPQYYRTSLTLPTSTRQRTRSTDSRENWFSATPETSTESSKGE